MPPTSTCWPTTSTRRLAGRAVASSATIRRSPVGADGHCRSTRCGVEPSTAYTITDPDGLTSTARGDGDRRRQPGRRSRAVHRRDHVRRTGHDRRRRARHRPRRGRRCSSPAARASPRRRRPPRSRRRTRSTSKFTPDTGSPARPASPTRSTTRTGTSSPARSIVDRARPRQPATDGEQRHRRGRSGHDGVGLARAAGHRSRPGDGRRADVRVARRRRRGRDADGSTCRIDAADRRRRARRTRCASASPTAPARPPTAEVTVTVTEPSVPPPVAVADSARDDPGAAGLRRRASPTTTNTLGRGADASIAAGVTAVPASPR